MKYQKTIWIPGEPKAQKRHRTARVGTFLKNYDPSKSDKGDFISQIRNEAPNAPLYGPIKVSIDFMFSRPKSHYGTGKNANLLKMNAPMWHTSKPDRDNLDKLCLDAMSKIFWRDDSQVCDGTIRKQYDNCPGIRITIIEL
jgi:Holliday junction resolvase RusA-like endonuclease